jgi:N-acetyl-anhydromuramyl-L-alanine amidase AmpD
VVSGLISPFAKFNSYLGIALVGDFDKSNHTNGTTTLSEPTTEQMQALVTLCRQLRARYKIPLARIIPHNSVARTKCPGDRFPFREFLRQIE